MKKLLLTALTAAASFMLFGAASASAEVGDIAGTIYTTDILTQVDGRDIQSYSMDGETLIALEDLEPYGFTLYYNDNIRTLFLTKTGEPSSIFHPHVDRGTVGGTAGYYYDTDINAVVNGEWIQAYAIDGKMAAKVETLGRLFEDTLYCDHPNFMTCNYDNSKRLLSLNTSLEQFGTPTEAKKRVLDYLMWHPRYCRILHSGDKLLAVRHYGGLMGGGISYQYPVVLENGLIYDAYQAALNYDIRMNDPVFSEDGKYLYFENTDFEGNFRDYKQLELTSMHVMPLDADVYNRAANRIIKSDYTLTLDGNNIPLYSIGSADYVKTADMKKNGYAADIGISEIYGSEEYIPLSDYSYECGYYDSEDVIGYSYDPYSKHISAFSIK